MVVFRNGNLFCDHCGAEHKLKFPIAVDEMAKKSEAFSVLHNDCKKTWTEPVVDQSKDTEEKAYWWMANGERGMSSEAMWRCFMNDRNGGNSHPHDPDDFKRCYKLLECVPEWKEKHNLRKLKRLSQQWSNLVDNWDKLTEMYEENVKTNWKEYKRIGMYEFMQKLIKTQ